MNGLQAGGPPALACNQGQGSPNATHPDNQIYCTGTGSLSSSAFENADGKLSPNQFVDLLAVTSAGASTIRPTLRAARGTNGIYVHGRFTVKVGPAQRRHRYQL